MNVPELNEMYDALKEEFHFEKKVTILGGVGFPANTFGNVLDLITKTELTKSDVENITAYSSSGSAEVYRNFLDWLFATFSENEEVFRQKLLQPLRLREGMNVLIVGCGLGEDIRLVRQLIGPDGAIHAQDLSREMVLRASAFNSGDGRLMFTISNALDLPYKDDYFDAVFHFGGINLFGDMKTAISELTRVTKVGGRTCFGDEGISEHLQGTDYYKIAVLNNGLWASRPPLGLIPHNAIDLTVSYHLGNCFYLISYEKGSGFPPMNLDIPHKGIRGGSARTRYYGAVEGISPETKAKLYEAARQRETSVHDVLETLVIDFLKREEF
jgi:ubiquinone/menaquinone biosynthesis C-methylase UbiE